MKNKLTISTGSIIDYEEFINLFSEIEELHRKQLPRKYKKPDPLFSAENFKTLLQDKNTRFIIAKLSDIVVGFAIAFLKHSSSRDILTPRSYIELDTICVAEKYKRKGIGKAILQDLEKWSTNIGIRDIQLNVWNFNKEAFLFYSKNGYACISTIMRKVL